MSSFESLHDRHVFPKVYIVCYVMSSFESLHDRHVFPTMF